MMLSDVCLPRTSGLSRKQRPRKTKIGTEVAHVTRDSDTTFKVKSQGNYAALLTAAFTHQAAAVVSVGKYSPWEGNLLLRCRLQARRSARRRQALRRPQREAGGEWRGHIVAPTRLQFVVITIYVVGEGVFRSRGQQGSSTHGAGPSSSISNFGTPSPYLRPHSY